MHEGFKKKKGPTSIIRSKFSLLFFFIGAIICIHLECGCLVAELCNVLFFTSMTKTHVTKEVNPHIMDKKTILK